MYLYEIHSLHIILDYREFATAQQVVSVAAHAAFDLQIIMLKEKCNNAVAFKMRLGKTCVIKCWRANIHRHICAFQPGASRGSHHQQSFDCPQGHVKHRDRSPSYSEIYTQNLSSRYYLSLATPMWRLEIKFSIFSLAISS